MCLSTRNLSYLKKQVQRSEHSEENTCNFYEILLKNWLRRIKNRKCPRSHFSCIRAENQRLFVYPSMQTQQYLAKINPKSPLPPCHQIPWSHNLDNFVKTCGNHNRFIYHVADKKWRWFVWCRSKVLLKTDACIASSKDARNTLCVWGLMTGWRLRSLKICRWNYQRWVE